METKDDTKIASPITFQPMPKRFMVWDKVGKQFLRKRLLDGIDMVFSIFELPLEIDCLDEEEKKQFIVCQSTNLFDKDGKEIFEGSIINVYENYNFGNGDNERDFDGVVVNHEGCWCINSWHGEDEIMQPLYEIRPEHITLTGHILSNPELLGEK